MRKTRPSESKKPLAQKKERKKTQRYDDGNDSLMVGGGDEGDIFIVCLFPCTARKTGLEQFKDIKDWLMWNVYVLNTVGPTVVILTLFIYFDDIW